MAPEVEEEKKETALEAQESIKEAEAAGDEDKLQEYALDERTTVSTAARKALDRIDGIEDEETGKQNKNVKDTLANNEKKQADQKKWTVMTLEEQKKYQAEGRLKGYDPKTGKGLLN